MRNAAAFWIRCNALVTEAGSPLLEAIDQVCGGRQDLNFSFEVSFTHTTIHTMSALTRETG